MPAQIGVNGHTTRFKLDTGAAVTVLSDDVQWLQDVELTKTSQVLHGPGNTQLPVKGLFNATLKYRQSQLSEPIYMWCIIRSAYYSAKELALN